MSKSTPTTMRQIPLLEMEHGLAQPIALLKLEPADLTHRCGVQFETTRDDLDELDGAVICSSTGRQFGLVRHRHQPEPGTAILTNECAAHWGADLREALQLLQLDRHELSWIHPEIAPTELV